MISAPPTLTSITAYRHYKSDQGGDIDYSTVDILYPRRRRQPLASSTPSRQELRLQGKAFDDKLDWLVGGYYANEDLTAHRQSALRQPIWPLRHLPHRLAGRPVRVLFADARRAASAPPAGATRQRVGPFGAAGRRFVSPAFDNLDAINDRGRRRDVYKQNSNNCALFTHNIFHVTDKIDVTVGLRYTHETQEARRDLRQRQHRLPRQPGAAWRLRDPASPASTRRCSRCRRRFSA